MPRPAKFALFCAILLAPPLLADERVKGSGIVKEETPVQKIFEDLLSFPIDQAEVDLFVAAVEEIEPWAREHLEEWRALDVRDETHLLAKLQRLEVWKVSSVSPQEFFALLVKMGFARDLAGADLAARRAQLETERSGMLEYQVAHPEHAKETAEALSTIESLLRALEHYPEGNLAIYRENKEKIDPAVTRLSALEGKEGG